MDDILHTLKEITPYGWRTFFEKKLNDVSDESPLDGLARGGYELIYRDTPSKFFVLESALTKTIDLSFSIGLQLKVDGEIQEVVWGSAGFESGLTKGARILGINGRSFSRSEMEEAVARAQTKIDLLVVRLKTVAVYSIEWDGGHRYPHLAGLGPRRLLDEIMRPRRMSNSCASSLSVSV